MKKTVKDEKWKIIQITLGDDMSFFSKENRNLF